MLIYKRDNGPPGTITKPSVISVVWQFLVRLIKLVLLPLIPLSAGRGQMSATQWPSITTYHR
ncbi:hypothetical protein T07_11003 [Trichinella nelsoni]|uniref:Uncharacterized protein n=1 Tax=Trichinella nelsoni TaxID=6336 RepID=A0A0V0SIU2_9BILA|nr:hypothetical protein T07_11003 [Trichinella nelsoni]